MAKKTTRNVTTKSANVATAPPVVAPPVEKSENGRPRQQRVDIDTVTVTIPVVTVDVDNPLRAHHVDVQNLSNAQGRAVASIMLALRVGGYTNSGRTVDSKADGIRWLLSEIADAIEKL